MSTRTTNQMPDWMSLCDSVSTAFVLFSGGKDSEAALVYTRDCLRQWAPHVGVQAISIDTTIGLPDTRKFVETFCKLIGVPLHVVQPRKDYFTLVKKWGVPRPKARWCCFHLKIEPLKEFLRSYASYIVIDGIRREESRKRSAYPSTYQHPHFGTVIHPIIDWSYQEVDRYLEERQMPINPAYSLGFGSWECWCGVYKRKSEFETLSRAYPDFFAKLVQLESELKSGYAYAYFDSKPFYLRDLLNESVKAP